MSSSRLPFYSWSLVASLLLLAPFFNPARAADWNVAVLDQLLAGVAPGQQVVQVGDMEILVSNLRVWRNELAGGPQPQLTFANAVPLWTGGNVYYAFSNNVSAAKQKAFLDASAEWATFANLHFIPRTVQANFITVHENPALNGGQSAVGMIGGEQSLQIGPNAWNRATLCHEIGHALGLVHEHQRSDRDTYVVVLTNNLVPGSAGNFVKLTGSQNIGPYDFHSVMHYGSNLFSLNYATLNTLLPQPAYSAFLEIMGSRFDPVLSALDRAGMVTNYGAGPVLGPVVTSTLDSGPGSLRAALYYAFDHPGTTITFNIPTSDPGFSNGVFNLLPTDALPSLANATVLDGTSVPTNSNPAGPEIFLNGVLGGPLGVYASGLRFRGTNSTARGLVIGGFSESGVLFDGATTISNTLTGSYVGVGPGGTTPVANGRPSVTLSGGASANTVGGTGAGQRNVIGGSPIQGLVIRDAGTRANVVLGNYIGVDATGSAVLSNAWSAIQIYGGAQSNVIGGVVAGARNVIAGNGAQGIGVSDTNTIGNVIIGNYIGLNAAGTAALGNAWAGVDLFNGTTGNRIGGYTAAEGNVISGNLGQGIAMSGAGTSGNRVLGNYIGLNPAGTTAIANGGTGVELFSGASAAEIGGTNTGAGNVISGNAYHGIALSGAGVNNHIVQGNIIGLNAAGTAAVPNGSVGVGIWNGASSNRIGGTVPAARNLISGNLNQGVTIANAGTRGNEVSGNFIGLNAAGTAAIGNSWSGVNLYGGCDGNLVGGSAPGAGNVISGNLSQGVALQDASTHSNLVQGNIIGLNPAGTAAIGNSWAGVDFAGGCDGNLVGGSTPGAGNVISGNLSQGVLLRDASTRSNSVQGNLIGLDLAGTGAIPNAWTGVQIHNGPMANVIGGAGGGRNFISGNGNYGIAMTAGSSANQVQGNTIGLNKSNNGAVPNGYSGVVLYGGAVSNQIGGVASGEANLISGNMDDGVRMFEAGTTGNVVRGNSIVSNTKFGIALYSGANLATAAPVLTSATLGTNTVVRGSLAGLASTTFLIDYYANPAPAVGAEGMTYLGARSVTTGAGGTVVFTNELGAIIPAGRVLTATATDPAGNTSAFSNGVVVTTISTPNDAISDAWRAAMFGGSGMTTNSVSCATCDPDADGLNNRAEFFAGTNPNDGASGLWLTALNPAGTGSVALLPSVAGISYRIESRDDLPASSWSLVADQVVGTGSPILILDPQAPVLPSRLYRAGVLW